MPNPSNNSTPIDTVNIVNIFFTVILAVGVILALVNISDFINVITRSIKIQKTSSQFFDPLKEDINALRSSGSPKSTPARYSASFEVISPEIDKEIEAAAKEASGSVSRPFSFGNLFGRSSAPSGATPPPPPGAPFPQRPPNNASTSAAESLAKIPPLPLPPGSEAGGGFF